MKDISQVDLVEGWGPKLKELRELNGFSREDVMSHTHIPVRRLQRLEIQETDNILSHELLRLSRLYRVEIDSFFNDTEDQSTVVFSKIFGKDTGNLSPADEELFKLFFNELTQCRNLSDEGEKHQKLGRIYQLISNFMNFEK